MIPRAELFGDASRGEAKLSPRGDMVAFLAPRDGYLNIWVVPVDTLGQARPLTDDQARGLSEFAWAQDGRSILYLQDQNGDENWRLYAIDVATGAERALTPAGARARIIGLSADDPGGVIVMLNERDPAWPDVVRIDIATDARTEIVRNTNTPGQRGFVSFVADLQNHVRLGLKALPDGGAEVFSRDPEGVWKSLFTIPFEDALNSYPLAFEADARNFLMLDSTGRDRAALVRVDAATGVKTVLGESPRADVVDVWLDPTTNAPEAFAAEYLRSEWRTLDPVAQADLEFLDAQLTGEPRVVSRSLDDKRWIVEESGPTTPARSYLYDRGNLSARRLTLLFRHRPTLERQPLQPMIPVEIEARDGLTLVSYLTLPINSDNNGDSRPDAPVPLVLVPHDGPWARDSYGFNALHQWLANRGFAALSVNFRGSSGFGKAFLNAGNREWGGRMQEDLSDAVQWAISNAIAQPERVAVFGAGYGGYAALMGLAASPGLFACGVSLNGQLNPSMLVEAPSLAAQRDALALRIGDPRDAAGRALLRERSPLAASARIERPLMLALGGGDRRAARADADQVSARAGGAHAIYLFYPDEGRILARPQNRLSFYAAAEQFLGSCLGGRTEPVGAAFEGARLVALAGAPRVPGLSAFAPRRPAPAPAAAEQAAPPPEPAESEDAPAPSTGADGLRE